MRQLLSGVAVAALLATGLPAITQAADDHSSSGATMAPDSTGQAVKAKAKHKRSEVTAEKRRTGSPDDYMAEELNRQQLQQLGQAPTGPGPSTGSSTSPKQ
jgi:hypothetical protein